MSKVLLIIFGLLPVAGFTQGIAPGRYSIGFGISDARWGQNVKFANFSTNLVCTYFDVIIEENGSFKRSDESRQLVRGLIYEGRFKFIIPNANADDVNPYIFEAENQEKNGKFEGACEILFTGPKRHGTSKFRFTMQRIAPNKIAPANRGQPVRPSKKGSSAAAGSGR